MGGPVRRSPDNGWPRTAAPLLNGLKMQSPISLQFTKPLRQFPLDMQSRLLTELLDEQDIFPVFLCRVAMLQSGRQAIQPPSGDGSHFYPPTPVS